MYAGIRYMKYGDAGTSQIAFPAGVMEARYCGVIGNTPTQSSTGGPQLVCALRDIWYTGAFYGLFKIGDGLPRSQDSSVTPVFNSLVTASTTSWWQWVFENPQRFWVATSAPTAGAVQLWERPTAEASAIWSLTGTYTLDSTQVS